MRRWRKPAGTSSPSSTPTTCPCRSFSTAPSATSPIPPSDQAVAEALVAPAAAVLPRPPAGQGPLELGVLLRFVRGDAPLSAGAGRRLCHRDDHRGHAHLV